MNGDPQTKEITNESNSSSQKNGKFLSDGAASFQRLLFFGTVLLLDLLATFGLADWFWQSGLHRAHLPLLVLFFILNGVVTFG
ncbi:MAG: hypothetical protein NZL93_04085, partial [Chthoniobacterales bacterium]|nr:hypothetical protein [Chthoniobacterales bacterium]